MERIPAAKTRHVSIGSPAISRLLRSYRMYSMEMMNQVEPILSLQEFYYMGKDAGLFRKNRLYEFYLQDLNIKEGIDEV